LSGARKGAQSLLDTVEHPNHERYGGQRIFVVRRDDDVCLVPVLEGDASLFLKTIIPSRKATRQYLGEALSVGRRAVEACGCPRW
jgi:hypothetical protein